MQQRETKQILDTAELAKSGKNPLEQLHELEHQVHVVQIDTSICVEDKINLTEKAIKTIDDIQTETPADTNHKCRIAINIAYSLLKLLHSSEFRRIRFKYGTDKWHFTYYTIIKYMQRLKNPIPTEIHRFIDIMYDAGVFANAHVNFEQSDHLKKYFKTCIHYLNLLHPLDTEMLEKLHFACKVMAEHSRFWSAKYTEDAERAQTRIDSKLDEASHAEDVLLREKFHQHIRLNDEKSWQIKCDTFSALKFPCALDIISMRDIVYQRIEALLGMNGSIEQLLDFLKLVIPYQNKFDIFDAKWDLNFLKEMAEADIDGKLALFDRLFIKIELQENLALEDKHYYIGMLDTLLHAINMLRLACNQETIPKINKKYRECAKTYYLCLKHLITDNLSEQLRIFYKITEHLLPQMRADNLPEDNNLFLRALLCLFGLIIKQIDCVAVMRSNVSRNLRGLDISNLAIKNLVHAFAEFLELDKNSLSVFDLYYKAFVLLKDNDEVRNEYLAHIISFQRTDFNVIPGLAVEFIQKQLFDATAEYKADKNNDQRLRCLCEYIIMCFDSADVKPVPVLLFEAHFKLGVVTKSHEQLLKALQYTIEKPSRNLQLMIADCHARLGFYFKEIGDAKNAREYIEAARKLYNAIDCKRKPKKLLKCEAYLADAADKEKPAVQEKKRYTAPKRDKDVATERHLDADADISNVKRNFLNALAELEESLRIAIQQIRLLDEDKKADFVKRRADLVKQFSIYSELKPDDHNTSKVSESITACAALNKDLQMALSTQKAATAPKESKWKSRPKEEVKEPKKEQKTKGGSQTNIALRLRVTTAALPAPAAHTSNLETKHAERKHAERKHDFLDYTVNRLSNLVAIYNKIQAIRELRAKGSTSAANDFDEQNLRLALIYNLLRICVYYKLHFQQSRLQNEVQLLQKLEDLRSMLIHQGAIELLDIDIVNLIPEFLQDFAREFKSERRFDKVHEIVGKVVAVDEKQIPLQKLLQALHTNDKFTTSLNMQGQLTNVVAYVLPIIQKISQPFIEFAADNGLDASLGQIKAKFTSHMQALKLLFAIFGEYYDASAFERAKNVAKDKRSELSGLGELITDCRKIFRNIVAHAADDGDAKAIYDMALRFQRLNSAMLKDVVYQCFKMPEASPTVGKKCR